MNVGQQIFVVFYAVLFGVMLNSTSGLHAFPWGFFYESPLGGIRLLWRLLVSIACLYVLPVLIFGLSFSILAGYPDTIVSIWHPPAIALSALVVFAPYRLYMVVMIGFRTFPIRIYSRSAFEEIAAQRHIRRSTLGQFMAFLFFSGLGLINFWVTGGIA